MKFTDHWNCFIYTLWAPVYDAMIRLHPATTARATAFSLAKIDSRAKVLLVGVGTGLDLNFIARSVNVVGVDLSASMLGRAGGRAERLQVEFCPIIADAATLPFHSEDFDVVVLTLILSVVPNPRQCLEESFRILRPEGELLVMDKFVPSDQSPSVLRRLLNLLTRFFGTDINRSWERMSAGLPFAVIDEATSRNGFFRTIVIRKHENPASD